VKKHELIESMQVITGNYTVAHALQNDVQVAQQQLIDWCFNGMSTQKGQFVPTAGEGNRLSLAKDGQRDTMHNTLRYTITM